MNQEMRKMNKEKENEKNKLSASVDSFVNNVKNVLIGSKEKSKDIQESLNDFNLYSNLIIEELRKQTKYKI